MSPQGISPAAVESMYGVYGIEYAGGDVHFQAAIEQGDDMLLRPIKREILEEAGFDIDHIPLITSAHLKTKIISPASPATIELENNEPLPTESQRSPIRTEALRDDRQEPLPGLEDDDPDDSYPLEWATPVSIVIPPKAAAKETEFAHSMPPSLGEEEPRTISLFEDPDQEGEPSAMINYNYTDLAEVDAATAEGLAFLEKRDAYIRIVARRQRIGFVALKGTNRKLTKASEAYSETRNNYFAGMYESLNAGNDPDFITGVTVAEADRLANDIARKRLYIAGSGKRSPFRFAYRHWANWGGLTEEGRQSKSGRAKKVVTMMAISGVTGLAVGAAVSTLGVGAIGGVIAAGTARGIARNLAKQKLDTSVEHSALIATDQSNSFANAIRKELSTIPPLPDPQTLLGYNTTTITEAINEATNAEIRRNRKRTAIALGVGAVTGAVVGAGMTELLSHAHDIPKLFGFDHHHSAPKHPAPIKPKTSPSPAPSAPATHQPPVHHPNHHHKIAPPAHPPKAATSNNGTIDGFNTNIYVPQGNGYGQELQSLAAERHINLSSAQSQVLYQQLSAQFHAHFFLDNHSYLRPQGDYGISRSGLSHWNPAVLRRASQLLTQQAGSNIGS